MTSFNPGPSSQVRSNIYALDTYNFDQSASLPIHQSAHQNMGIPVSILPTGATTGEDGEVIQALLSAFPSINIILKPGANYYNNRPLTLSGNQTISFNGATWNKVAQVSITTTATITGNEQTFAWKNTNTLNINQTILLSATGNRMAYAYIKSIDPGNSITIQSVVSVAIDNATSPVAFPWSGVTTTLANTWCDFTLDNGAKLDGLIYQGISATSEKARWEATQVIHNIGNGIVTNCTIYDAPGEGIMESVAQYTTLAAAINAGDTTCTLTSVAGLVAGDMIQPTDITTDTEVHVITAINPGTNVVTVSPAFKKASANGAGVIRLMQGCRYENVTIIRCGGNGLHRSASFNSYSRNYKVYNSNLAAATAGHQEGCFTWSNWAYASHDDHPVAYGSSLAGFGGLDSASNSTAKIIKPIIQNCTANSVLISDFGGADSIKDVYFDDPLVIDSGLFQLTISSNTQLYGPMGTKVNGGNFIRSFIKITGGEDTEFNNTYVDFYSTATPSNTQICFLLDGAGVTLNNCRTRGGYHGIKIQYTRNSGFNTMDVVAAKINGGEFWFAYQEQYNNLCNAGASNLPYYTSIQNADLRDLCAANRTPGYNASVMPYVNTATGKSVASYFARAEFKNNYVLCSQDSSGCIAVDSNSQTNYNTLIMHYFTASGIQPNQFMYLNGLTATCFGEGNLLVDSGDSTASTVANKRIQPAGFVFKTPAVVAQGYRTAT